MSENKYRDYLSDEGSFHRRYLKNEDEPVGSSFFAKAALGIGAAVGVGAGLMHAYKSGALAGSISAMIENMGKFRTTQAGHISRAFRNWTEDPVWKDMGEMGWKDRLATMVGHFQSLPNYVDEGIANHIARTASLRDKPITDEITALVRKVQEQGHVLNRMEARINGTKYSNNAADNLEMRKQELLKVNRSRNVMNEEFDKMFNLTADQEKAQVTRLGMRQAKVKDLYEHLDDESRKIIDGLREMHNAGQLKHSVDEKIIDPNIFVKPSVNNTFQIHDTRDFRHTLSNAMDTLAEDFTMPFVKINPIRMFYLNDFTRTDLKPSFALLRSENYQPTITGTARPLGQDMLYVNGRVLDLNDFDNATGTFRTVEENGYLLDATGKNSPITRLSRNMMGLTTSTYGAKPEGLFRGAWYELNRVLDVGFQDEPIRGINRTDIGDPLAPLNAAAAKLHNGFGNWDGLKPYETVHRIALENAYGPDPDWFFMRSFKTMDQSKDARDFASQFFAGRNTGKNVTTASFFYYGLFERLNATLNGWGLGLSTKNLGSGHQIFGNLVGRRILPLYGAALGVKYFNYEYENLFGEELEDDMAKFYANSQISLAEVRDTLGLTDMFKEMGQTMPGFEFISELPIPILTTEGLTPIPLKDIAPLNKSAEEVKDYYLNGEEGVRKGRYWEFGNTPYTGGKMDYYQPNWFRRITSDWEYTDTLYGSKDEYWANSPVPTLTHPFAPIKHFLLDPYHWEKKHYEDRPYMMTGGLPELEQFPLIGPILNATVGQIVKPSVMMHQDEWLYSGSYEPSSGEKLAQEYGLVGGGAPSASIGSPLMDVSNAIRTGYGGAGQYGGNVEPISYVTSSGNAQVMANTSGEDIRSINQRIREAGIGKTGAASPVRSQAFQFAADAESPANPASMSMALSDAHYNLTELGGFYGWVSTMPFGKDDEYKPKIQTSIKAYGYERSFWDKDLGNLGFDYNEIFRRFVTRDAHKNYTNSIDNEMPTWMPGANYFTNFQQGDPYVKVKKGEMRLPGEAYETLYGIDSQKLDRLEIGASSIGYEKVDMIKKWLHRDDVQDDAKTFVTKRGTDWHTDWEREMMEKGIAARKSNTDEDNFSIIGGGKEAYKKFYVEGYVKDEAAGIGGFYDVLANHDKGLEWMLENAAEFTYYKARPDGAGDSQEGFFDKVEVSKMDSEKQRQIFQYLLAQSDKVLLDPKTRTEQRWREDEMHFENVQQVNFYAGQMGTKVNYLIHVNTAAKEGEKAIKVFAFDYNPALEQYTRNKVSEARRDVKQMIEDGVIGRGDLYGPVDRYRILADVAPYSQEYRDMKSQLSLMNLTDEEKKEIQAINDQVSSRKDRVRTYDYRFKTADVRNMTVKVTKVLDNNTFLTDAFPDNPIKLAGVYVPTGKDDPVAKEAHDMINDVIRQGVKITISVNADDANLVNPDTYGTVSAVVRGGAIRNLNRQLIEAGLAKEKEEDYSPAAVHARFTPGQIQFGKVWETFAHMDTPFHTKLMQVRSPLEQYERRQVYGKDWQDWTSPVEDFIIPWYQNMLSHSAGWGIGLGAFMGAMFGNTRYGKFVGALFGATATTLGLGTVGALEIATGEKWIPERRIKERNVEEYFDMLKYVKYKSLYAQTAALAKKDGFDVERYLSNNASNGDARKMTRYVLEEAKRKLKVASLSNTSETAHWRDRAKDIVGGARNDEELIGKINKKLGELQNNRHVDKLTPLAAQAIMYYNEAEKTMYGYDPGDPIANVLSALPKKEREYLAKFIEAPEEERNKILDVVPSYVKRVLQSAWGMKADKKPTVEEYFTDHQLPTADWVGWDPRANLDDIKIKLVKREGLDASEFDIWAEDEKRAAQVRENVVPQLNFDERIGSVKERLRDILGGAGIKDLDIQVERSDSQGIHMNFDIQKSRREEIRRELNNYGGSLLV